jgi:hypothetical protein
MIDGEDRKDTKDNPKMERLERELEGMNQKMQTAINYNMNYFRVIFTALGVAITVLIVVFGYFGLTSFRDIQSIGEIRLEMKNARNELKEINELLKEAVLREMVLIYRLDGVTKYIASNSKYDLYYVGFPKLQPFEILYFTCEMLAMSAGDTAYIKIFATDRSCTLSTDEIMVTSMQYSSLACSLDISELENGPCEFAYGIKIKGKEGAELRNAYAFMYSQLTSPQKSEGNDAE